jgi:hypothetical protein
MELVKIGIVIAAGLGSTWAARQVTDVWLGPQQARTLAQAQPGSAPASPPESPAEAPAKAPPAVPEMSREEMEAELERARKQLAGERADDSGGDVREFRPTRPLPADLAIALPSDI